MTNCSKNVEQNKTNVNKEVSLLKIDDQVVENNLLVYNKENSTWTFNEELYSGYSITKYENDSLKRKFGVLNGKKQNEDISWFLDGKIKSSANYHQGKLHGEKKRWIRYPVHRLVSHYNYYLGKGQGKQIKWYPTGELFHVINLKDGREEGVQQAYRKNGKLFANYEMKNGRIFGIKKASLCFGLKNEKIKNEN